jgi:hypothetical protein
MAPDRLAEFTAMLRAREPFSFVKFGHAEWICMSGRWGPRFPDQWHGQNSDGQSYSADAGRQLVEAYVFFCRNAQTFVGESAESDILRSSREMYDALHATCGSYEARPRTAHVECLIPIGSTAGRRAALTMFYRTLAAAPGPKCFVGPEHIRPICDVLHVDTFVPVPTTEAFKNYDAIKPHLTGLPAGTIIGLSASFTAKIGMRHAMVTAQGPITCLDFGSAFDSFGGVISRSYQQGQAVSRQFFEEL